MKRTLISVIATIFFELLATPNASAIPVFAHRYNFSCETCHSTIPQLNSFGQAFLQAGFRIPGAPVRPVVPIAAKINLVYSSDTTENLPKAIVDELEFIAAGPVNKNFAYRLEQYVVDGGRVGLTRDAWFRFDSNPAFRERTLRVLGGQFTLPLPVDPETMRESLLHYAIFDQTVGNNPFTFFDPKIGVDAAYGNEVRGLKAHVALMQAHDSQSGLPAGTVDTMFAVAQNFPRFVVSGYRYEGRRPLGPAQDAFWREAIAATMITGNFRLDALSQTGMDSSANGFGLRQRSSGGYVQSRWEFSPSYTALGRYDFAQAADQIRSVNITFVCRVNRNGKLTVEVVRRYPQRSNVFNAAMLVAY